MPQKHMQASLTRTPTLPPYKTVSNYFSSKYTSEFRKINSTVKFAAESETLKHPTLCSDDIDFSGNLCYNPV